SSCVLAVHLSFTVEPPNRKQHLEVFAIEDALRKLKDGIYPTFFLQSVSTYYWKDGGGGKKRDAVGSLK
ncbi:hypothetical protein L9F63_000112, partial [Diploptera punctata]